MSIVKRVRTVFTGVAGTPWYSNMYFGGDVDDQAAVDGVATFWNGLLNFIDNDVAVLTQGEVTVITVETGVVAGLNSADPVSQNGQNAADPLPRATQLLLQLHTGEYVGGREIRGKVFLPGFCEDNTTGGVFNGAAVAAANAAAEGLRDNGVFNDGWVVYSRKNNRIDTVDTATASAKPAILRSRRD